MDNAKKRAFVHKLRDIEYKGDIVDAAQEYIVDTYLQAIKDLIDALPSDKKQTLNETIDTIDDDEKISEYVKGQFSVEELRDAIEKASHEAIQNWITKHNEDLNAEQKKVLLEFVLEQNESLN